MTKKVKQYTLDKIYIQTFNSIKECAKYFNVTKQHISCICNNKGKFKNFILKYEEDSIKEKEVEKENNEALNFDINKIFGLGEIVKTHINEIGYDFTEDELDRIKRIKKRNKRSNRMSYSICLNCKNPVTAYEKYCPMCELIYKQDETYWKNHHFSDIDRDEELTKDKIKGD